MTHLIFTVSWTHIYISFSSAHIDSHTDHGMCDNCVQVIWLNTKNDNRTLI